MILERCFLPQPARTASAGNCERQNDVIAKRHWGPPKTNGSRRIAVFWAQISTRKLPLELTRIWTISSASDADFRAFTTLYDCQMFFYALFCQLIFKGRVRVKAPSTQA